jgi:hypothetical protein
VIRLRVPLQVRESKCNTPVRAALSRDNASRSISKSCRESFKKAALARISRGLTFGVPLNRQHKAQREFDGFDGAIFRVSGADPHPWRQPPNRLVVPRVHLPGFAARDLREQGARLNRHPVCGQTLVGSAPHVASGGWQVLNQAAAQMYVQRSGFASPGKSPARGDRELTLRR